MCPSTMNDDFWLSRWNAGQIGFHRFDVHPKLVRHIDWPNSARVFVPLSGKSVDMAWLGERGHDVVGVELSKKAIREFFEEGELSFEDNGDVFVSKRVTLHAKNVFDIPPPDLGRFEAIYDRAALVAIGPDDRARYANLLLDLLSPGGSILLVTLDYDPTKMRGPPHAVRDEEVRRLFGDRARVEQLERQAILDEEPHFAKKGLDWLDEIVWRISVEVDRSIAADDRVRAR